MELLFKAYETALLKKLSPAWDVLSKFTFIWRSTTHNQQRALLYNSHTRKSHKHTPYTIHHPELARRDNIASACITFNCWQRHNVILEFSTDPVWLEACTGYGILTLFLLKHTVSAFCDSSSDMQHVICLCSVCNIQNQKILLIELMSYTTLHGVNLQYISCNQWG